MYIFKLEALALFWKLRMEYYTSKSAKRYRRYCQRTSKFNFLRLEGKNLIHRPCKSISNLT